MDILSAKTSHDLKKAGFPQHKPKIGQTWYETGGTCFVITDFFDANSINIRYIEGSWVNNTAVADNDIYAPTATEILRELGDAYSLYYISKEDRYIVAQDGKVSASSHENAAEAAAMEYLKMKNA